MSFQIETERLIIRDVREDDIPTLVAQCAEVEARENILASQLDAGYNRRDLENAIAWAKQPRRKYYKLAVELKNGGVLIGSCTISDVVRESFQTSIGWHYGQLFRRNGYATEAAGQLLRIGFELNNVASIYADCFTHNKASIRIMEKIGMNAVWNFSLLNIIRGLSYSENRPTVRYAVSRNQWSAFQNKHSD